jgi:hypothetical protein
MPRKAPKDVLEAKIQKVTRRLLEHIAQRERLAIVKAPPGSGKTYLLLQGVHHARQRRRRVAVACQTNSQANDVCSRLSRDYPDVAVVRFAGGGSQEIDLGQTVTWVTDKKELPAGPCVVVGTTAKWGLVEIEDPFDVFLVDEAWQMAWKDFMLCGQVAERVVLIGDPGQIPPVVTLDVSRCVKAEVSCPENTEVRCPLFTDGRVRSVVMPGPPPPRRRPAGACGPAAPPSSFRGADSCRP